MKSLSAALFVGLCLCGGRAEAQIAVNGYADAGGPVGVGLQLVGSSRGFTYEQGFSVRHNIPGADTCNGEPLNCAPGTTVSLAVRGTDQSGTATLDGQTYAVSPNGINTIDLQFDASIVLPALAPTAQVTSSFTFTGSFTYRPQDSSTSSTVSLTGNGTVIAYLHSPNSAGFPNSWHIDRVAYVFAPIVPGSLLTQTDVGDVGQPGGASFNGSQFDVWGSGADIGGTTDAFHFVFQEPLPPNGGDIAVRVDSESAINPDAKAGVMFRGGFDAGATHVMLAMRPDGGVELLTRSAAGGATSVVASTNASFPIWLKLHLTSSGAQCAYAASVSSDAAAWTPLGSVTLSTPCPGDVGLAVTSHDNATVNHAVFDTLSVGLPSPWQDTDIGAVGLNGVASFLNGTFTVNGAGSDIWGTADSFNYLSQTIYGEGDAQIVARVTSMRNTATWAKAGIMIRDPFNADAANVLLDETPNGTVEFLVRSSAGTATVGITNAFVPFPGWLKLVRSGNTITAFISSDGSTWTNLASTNVSFAFQPLIGLAVTSHDPSQLNTATFDHVAVTMYTSAAGDVPPTVSITSPSDGSTFAAGSTITVAASASDSDGTVTRVDFYANGSPIGTRPSPYSFSWTPSPGSYTLTAVATDNGSVQTTSAPVSVTVSSSSGLPGPWTSQDIGSTGLAGSASESNGTFTVKGAGADIWGTADSFQFVSQPVSGDVTIVARVTAMTNTATWAKAGIMIRASTYEGAADVLLDETPGGTVEFLERSSAGTATYGIANASLPFPGWLKLVRNGNTVTASISSDGTSWTTVGTTTLAIVPNALVGLAVTSHDTSQLNTSTFDNVSVTTPSTPVPGTPASPSPPDAATGIGTSNVTLTWSAAGATSYDVDFGTTNPPNRVSTGQSSASFSVWSLAFATTYYWQIVAHNSGGATTGPVWSFTTAAAAPPGPPSNPNPPDRTMNAGTSPTLSWSAASGATSYDVRLGLTNPPPPVATQITATSYAPAGPLAANSTYYWQIVANGDQGSTAGPIWSFSTGTGDIVIYATDILGGNVHGDWRFASDSTSPNSSKLVTPATGTSNAAAPLATPGDYVDVSFSAPANVAYTLWLRVQATNNSKWSDSLWAQFSDARSNGSAAYPTGSTAGLAVNLATDSTASSDQGWGWVNSAYWLSQATTVSFATSGTHILRIQTREAGVMFDQVVLSPGTYFNASASCPNTCGASPGSQTNDTTIVRKQ